MKPTDRGSAERSSVDEWIDVARHGDPEAAETRRAKMLVASHREARLEATQMNDFDAARAPRPGDDKVIDAALSKVLAARMRSSSARLRSSAPAASVTGPAADFGPDPTSGVVVAGSARASDVLSSGGLSSGGLSSGGMPLPRSMSLDGPSMLDAMEPLEASPRSRMLDDAPRVANAIATPGPQRAVRVEARRPSFARLGATLGAGIALGASVALVALQSTGWSIGRDPDHDAAPRAAAMEAVPSHEVVTAPRDPRELAAEEALDLLAASSADHAAARRLAYARELIEQGELERASRVLRVVGRRWPRRAEAGVATLALGHVYVALGWPRSAERTWARWLRAHPGDPAVSSVREQLASLADVEDERASDEE